MAKLNVKDITYTSYLETYRAICEGSDECDLKDLFVLDLNLRVFILKYALIVEQIFSTYMIELTLNKFPYFEKAYDPFELKNLIKKNKVFKRVPGYIIEKSVRIAREKWIGQVSFSHIVQFMSINNFTTMAESLFPSFLQQFINNICSAKKMNLKTRNFFQMLTGMTIVRNVSAHNGQVISLPVIEKLKQILGSNKPIPDLCRFIIQILYNTGLYDEANQEFEDILVNYKEVIGKYNKKLCLI